MDKKEVVVVVPVYRPELTVWERASLRQTVGVLQENYPVELLVPCGMDCSAIRREFSGLPVREVSDEWLLLWKTMEGCMLYRLLPDWVLLGGKGI